MRSRHATSALLALTLTLLGCESAPGETQAAPNPAPRYQLSCDSMRHSGGGKLLCVRINTSTGDAKLVDVDRVPASGPHTAGDAMGSGAYQLVCATSAAEKGESFSCLRMNAETGELVALALKHLPQIP